MRKINKLARIAGTVAVAGAAAAAALAVTPGTFGGFTSATSNTNNSVQAGTLTMTNSVTGPVVVSTTGLGLTNMKPGDVASGSVTITNSGSLPADLTLGVAGTQNFPAGDLVLTITQDGTQIYSGAVTDVAPWALVGNTVGGTWAAGESHDYDVTVELKSTADNEAQGDSASFTLNWAGAQH